MFFHWLSLSCLVESGMAALFHYRMPPYSLFGIIWKITQETMGGGVWWMECMGGF
jgi:hypothetical protein